MSPPIQGDGGRPRLEWTPGRDGLMHAKAGHIHLSADPENDRSGHAWEITCQGLAPERDPRPCGHEASLLAAQLAAEDAARDLLCSALAAFAEAPLPHGYVVREVDESEAGEEAPLVMLSDECTDEVFTPDDARRLAIALLGASQGGGK